QDRDRFHGGTFLHARRLHGPRPSLCWRREFPPLYGRYAMRLPHALLLVPVAFLLIAAEDAKKDLKKLEGTWSLVSGELAGQKLPEDAVKNSELTIKGNKHTVKVGDDTFIGTHKVNPDKSPKAIDTMDTSGPFKDKTLLGIYEVHGDEFKV